MQLKVLVVDDTVLFRKIVSDVISSLPNAELVGTASNGSIAMRRLQELCPDIMILDIEMPGMNGIQVLEAIKNQSLDVGVIMLSSLTVKGGDMTVKALQLGAFDFITKPTGTSIEDSRTRIRSALEPMLSAYGRQREIQLILKGKHAPTHTPQILRPQSPAADPLSVTQRMMKIAQNSKSELVLIGISTGGPNALSEMLPKLPGDINVPLLIVQHMPPTFTQSLAKSLDAKCAIHVKEAEDNEKVLPNTAYIAPGGTQMKLILHNGQKTIRITDDPPENNCKPAVDYLFRSAAHNFPGKTTAVIMTGMGRDGTLGLQLIKRNGSVSIAQDESSCIVFGMPKEAIQAGVVDIIAPLDRIADEIIKTVRRIK
ncbi:MAG: protein-glutamate methylesterase/protein-glutamine glutaminase [bacterium]